jgi:hypothetical protein
MIIHYKYEKLINRTLVFVELDSLKNAEVIFQQQNRYYPIKIIKYCKQLEGEFKYYKLSAKKEQKSMVLLIDRK